MFGTEYGLNAGDLAVGSTQRTVHVLLGQCSPGRVPSLCAAELDKFGLRSCLSFCLLPLLLARPSALRYDLRLVKNRKHLNVVCRRSARQTTYGILFVLVRGKGLPVFF